MRSSTEIIKEKLSVVDIIGSYIKLEPAGKNFKACCPFHNEKTASFFVSPERNSYYCFGCGAKGDIFSFVQAYEGLDFIGSLKVLADKAGVKLENFEPKKDSSLENTLRKIHEEAVSFFESALTKKSNVLKYLTDRGLTAETLKEWQIGYAEEDWNLLNDWLIKKGFSQKNIESSGLIKLGSNNKYYDRFRGRIMFPIFDTIGRPIAFSGRAFSTKTVEQEAKYVNSPETDLFNKSSALYGYNKAKDSIRKVGFSIFVEGQFDLILCHQAGYKNTVAVSGTALTEGHLQLVKRFSDNIIFAFDADDAGFKAVIRASVIALPLGMNVKVCKMPSGQDPADIIKNNSEDWKRVIKNSIHIIDDLLEKIKTKNSDLRNRALKIKKEVLPLIALIPSKVEQGTFVTKVADLVGESSALVFEELKQVEKSQSNQFGQTQTVIAELNKADNLNMSVTERLIAGFLLLNEKQTSSEVDSEKLMEIIHSLSIFYQKYKNLKDEDKEILVFEAERDLLKENLSQNLKETVIKLMKEEWQDENRSILIEIKEAEKRSDINKALTLISKQSQLTKKMNALSIESLII